MRSRLASSYFCLTSLIAAYLSLSACGSPVSIPGSTGGAPSLGGTAAAGGTSGGAQGGTPNGGASAGGATSGGSSASGGNTAGGSASIGGQSSGGGTPSGGSVGAGGGGAIGGANGTSGGSGNADPCPADATFCSGFDDSALPAGAVFKLNGDPATPWTKYFEVDATVKRAGASSLRVKSVSEASDAYKMLSVPSGGANFWVRLYIRSDKDLGDEMHNVFGQASGSDEPNDSVSVEFAEDVGISFNSQDNVRWPEGFGRLTSGGTMPYTLAKDTWHCIELHFDGMARVQELYVNGERKINATDYPAATKAFQRFKFGYNALHGMVRATWYDDIAVGPTRPGCLN
jgi:hypothetical protein